MNYCRKTWATSTGPVCPPYVHAFKGALNPSSRTAVEEKLGQKKILQSKYAWIHSQVLSLKTRQLQQPPKPIPSLFLLGCC